MASLTQWTRVWVSSGIWWWTGRPEGAAVHGVAKIWTQLSNWTELTSYSFCISIYSFTWYYFLLWRWLLSLNLMNQTASFMLFFCISLISFSFQGIRVLLWICCCSVWLFVIPWTLVCQDPPFMGFSRQEYWSGLPFSSPGDLPSLGINPTSPALTGRLFTTEPTGKPWLLLASLLTMRK